MFCTHQALGPPPCLSCPGCCFPVGVGPLGVLAHSLGHPGTADPLPASPLHSAAEKRSPQHCALLLGSAGSTEPAEPQTQQQSGSSYLLCSARPTAEFFGLFFFAFLSQSSPLLNPTAPEEVLFTLSSPGPPPTPLQCDPHLHSCAEISSAPHVLAATVSARLRLGQTWREMDWEGGGDMQGGGFQRERHTHTRR